MWYKEASTSRAGWKATYRLGLENSDTRTATEHLLVRLCVRCAPGSSGGKVIRRNTSVGVRGRSQYVSSIEPHRAESAADSSEAEDWQSTHADQELYTVG